MKQFLVMAAACLVLAVPAYAQNAGSVSNAQVTNSSNSGSSSSVYGNPIGNGASSSLSGAQASSGSRSASTSQSGISTARTGASSASTGASSAAITINNGTGTAGDPSSDPAGNGDPTINYTGGYTVRNVPDVVAPSIVGGNPCAVGVSGGVAVAGFGISGGGTWADRACERRQEAALLYNIGQHNASIALLCQDDHVREAMYSVGQACGTRVAMAAPPVAQASAIVARPMVAVAPAVRVAPIAAATKPARPDWCDTVSGAAERARFRTQCQWFPTAAAQARPGRVAWNNR
jgi:hypothetical protein